MAVAICVGAAGEVPALGEAVFDAVVVMLLMKKSMAAGATKMDVVTQALARHDEG